MAARIRKLVPVGLLAAALVPAAVLAAPSAGTFKTTSGPAFSFTIKRMVCVTPPKNLKNPNARSGKHKLGLCFNSVSEPPVTPKCPPPGSISGDVALVDSFSRLLLSASGSLHVKTYSYSGSTTPDGYDELSLTVRGSKATGFVRVVTTIYPNGTATICDTGKLKFTAHRR